MNTSTKHKDREGTRSYNNSKRRAGAQATRNAILDALAEQLATNNTPEFSIDDAAAVAGVTRRTVFRHFPSREHMMSALADRVLEITGKVAIPCNSEEYVENVQATYTLFAEHPELMRALLLSELGRGVRSRLRERRRKGNAAALDEVLAMLPPGTRQSIAGVLGHLVTAESWWQLQNTFGIPPDEAANTIGWLARLAIEAVKRGDYPGQSQTDGKQV